MIFVLLIMAATLCAEDLQATLLYSMLGRQELLSFACLSSPHAGKELGVPHSRYEILAHHRHVAAALERLERGEINRLEIELPPRHGKSELAVRKFVPWFVGRHPDRSVIVVTHTDTLANEHGRDVRDACLSPAYRLSFTHRSQQLRDDSKAVDRLKLRGGSVITFTGRSGLGAGVGADMMVFDDFFKNTEEAESPTVRDNAWRMFIADCQSRLNDDRAPVVIIGTRRHEDDVQGRLFDPQNMHHDEREAARWTRIRLPALAEDADPLGRVKDEPLWPQKFAFGYYEGRRNHRSDIVRIDYQTQDQCNPVALEGNYFKRRWLSTYTAGEMPSNLRIYAASDHAYRKDQRNDLQCLLVVGVDPSDTIWVLPDTWWERAETDVLVEQMITIMDARHPATWWAARDAISGSIGPFLAKRMKERKVFAFIDDDMREDRDLERRAQSIRNRMAMGMVKFPSFAPWWGNAERELTAFPNAKHDDFCAALALLGMGLDKMIKANAPYAPQTGLPKAGTLAWVKRITMKNQAEDQQEKATKGW